MKLLRRLTEIFLLAFVFLLPWQTKLILRASASNFTEISLYASHLALILALISFFSYQLTKKGGLKDRPLAVWYFLGGLEIFILVSFFFAPDKLLAAYHYFLFLGGLGLFYLLREGMKRIPYEESCLSRTRAIYVFLISMFLQSSLGIYQFLSQSSFASKYFGLAEHNPQILGVSVVETLSGRWLRAYGGMDHPNIFGGILVFVLLFSAFALVRKKIINSQIQVWGVLLLFFSYFFALAALFFTFSRAAWLAYFIGLGVLLVSVIRKEERWVAGRLVALILFSVVLFTTAFLPYRELVLTRLSADTRLEIISLTERQDYLTEAAVIIKKNPLFGAGTGNYIRIVEEARGVDDYRNQPVHNTFLLMFAESGVFAFLFLILFLVFLSKDDKRQTLSLPVILALIIIMMFDHWLFSLPFGILFFFFILGVI